ncbi:MAG: hypothetical protein ACLVHQ_02175 [Oscillospiraceae bacterium]
MGRGLGKSGEELGVETAREAWAEPWGTTIDYEVDPSFSED